MLSSSFLVGIFLYVTSALVPTLLGIVGIFCMLQHLFTQVHTHIFDCILFLDSLKMHNKNDYARPVRNWLNYAWTRLGHVKIGHNSSPFDADSLPLVSPNSRFWLHFSFTTSWNVLIFSSFLSIMSLISVPYQDNGCNCGVSVCRYA